MVKLTTFRFKLNLDFEIQRPAADEFPGFGNGKESIRYAKGELRHRPICLPDCLNEPCRGEDLRSRNFQAKLFRKTIPDFGGKAVVDMPGANLRNVHHGHWRGCGHCHYQPDQRGQSESEQGR